MEIINPENLLLKVAPILDELKIDYYITGGFAVSVWYGKSGESSRHIEDVESVFKISGEDLDLGYLKKQAAKIGVSGLLKKFLK